MTKRNKLKYYESRMYAALFLGGHPDQYQLDEDDMVYYNGKKIGRFVTTVGLNKEGMVDFESTFHRLLPTPIIEISFTVPKN